jgi:hypothetical protein
MSATAFEQWRESFHVSGLSMDQLLQIGWNAAMEEAAAAADRAGQAEESSIEALRIANGKPFRELAWQIRAMKTGESEVRT